MIQKSTVTLHKYNAAWGLPDLSPFCIKVETYLRMIGVPFEPIVTESRKAPKKKLPFITDGTTVIDDSRDIIAHFEAKIAQPLDAGLSDRERALSIAFRALLEAEAYFYAVYLRWQTEDGWQVYQPTITQYVRGLGVPGFVVPFIVRSVRKKVIRDLWSQGAGRYTRTQVEARLCAGVSAVSTQLGEGPFFLGARPRTIDATVHAFMWSMLDAPFESRARTHARSLQNLRAYCDRMRQTYFAPSAGSAA
jgi:glutathione S-transferase